MSLVVTVNFSLDPPGKAGDPSRKMSESWRPKAMRNSSTVYLAQPNQEVESTATSSQRLSAKISLIEAAGKDVGMAWIS
ncbi:hypothetical protein PV08_11424 [Exophiala spinifera]|uniref:Uncharacterized protein n=1 Tax=Exophiala spinifera TaxID=91928 RepID=A0A0D2AVK2_9EURO|nr:uncharacterized protein PV08_11424 [Exophiala spinifera]KIW10460.1 hypothetical protein PV08_11424 [Exophiala spinifera]